MDSAAQATVTAQIEALLLAPLFERSFAPLDSLGGLGAELFARELGRSLERRT